VLALFVLIVAMVFAPWQQNVKGNGRVVAFSPLVREQTVEVSVSGRITKFAENISEGMHIKEGDFIAEVRDLDDQYLTRLKDQLAAKKRELEHAKEIITAYSGQVKAFESARDATVSAADEYIKMASQKKLAEQRNLEAAEAALSQEQLNFDRQKKLEADGLTSTLTLQVQERKLKEAQAKVEQAKAYVAAAENEIEAKRSERTAKERESTTKIDTAQAMFRKANVDVEKTEKEVLELESKVAQQQNQTIRAPIDGFVFRVHRFQGGQIVKQGDSLLTIVPDTADRAVEIWLDGNDAPLVTPGRHVRLQFEGWPAVQFTGWPSVSVGSFGGRVAMIDATDDGTGKFRILVVPDKDDEPWPDERFLRQGVQAHGWVLLEQVTLGFEIWRQLNGFPPVVDVKEPSKKDGKSSILKKAK
jgi:multidrug efflux pump subunit AcrA (membrane-fusion protein)